LTDEQRDQIGARLVTMQAGSSPGSHGGGMSPQNAGTSPIGVKAAAALVNSTPARIERARTPGSFLVHDADALVHAGGWK
jgi:hypothetical protein